MKKTFLILLLQLFIMNSFAQNYIAVTTSGVNMREGPSTEYDIIKRLAKGSALYVDLDEEIDGWYLAVDIENDIEGYVSSRYVKLAKRLSESSATSIQKSAPSYNYDPILHIKNSSSTSMTLRINITTYKLSPFSSIDVTMMPGRFTFRASAPGVVPKSGEYTIENNYDYKWEFYIVTRR